MYRGAWQDIVHGVTESDITLVTKQQHHVLHVLITLLMINYINIEDYFSKYLILNLNTFLI